MIVNEIEPTGHLQVKPRTPERGKRRAYHAYWIDARGKHGKMLGPAHVKDSGRKTPRGATIWRIGDGPKPTRDHLTPKEAKRELEKILRDAPRRVSLEPVGSLSDALEGSLDARIALGKIDPGRRGFYETMHARICRELGGDQFVEAFNTNVLADFIQNLESQKFIGPAQAKKQRLAGGGVKEVVLSVWTAQTAESAPKRVGRLEARRLETNGHVIKQRETKRWAICSPASVESKLKYRDLLSAAFEYAVDRAWIETNPVDNVPRPSLRDSREATLRREDFYDRVEISTLIEHAPSTLERAVWLCGCHAGFRLPGEAQGLVWGSVDFDANVIRAQDAWKRGQRGQTKTGKTIAIPMTPQLRAALAELKQRGYRFADRDHVFTRDELGRPVPDKVMRKTFHATAKRAGLKPIRMYNLRHSFGTSLAASGRVPNRTIQELMRHRQAGTTEIYTAYSPQPDLERQLMAALEPAIAPIAATASPEAHGGGDLGELRQRLIDRLDEQIPAKWLRTVAVVFDTVARDMAHGRGA